MRKTAGLSLDLSLVNWVTLDEKTMVNGGGGAPESQRISRMDDYLNRLEEERRKIHVFERELPLSMILLDDAILRLKEEAKADDACDKKKWMSSFQLWSAANPDMNLNSHRRKGYSDQEDDNLSTCEDPNQACKYGGKGRGFVPYKVTVPGFERQERKDQACKYGGKGREFVPHKVMVPGFERQESKEDEREVVSKGPSGLSMNASVSPLRELGFMTSRGVDRSNQLKPEGKVGDQQQQQHQIGGNKKQRRCWSSELHRRFVDSLEKLGGSHVATPKQIRDLMQADGLTNDEVKSHLQKYRLHLRKHPSASAIPGNHRLWIGQDENTEHSDPNIMQVISPQGPLNPSGTAKDMSSTLSDSMQADDDDKSESHSWNGPHQKP